MVLNVNRKVDEDGFTKVTRKKWRPKTHNNKHEHGKGPESSMANNHGKPELVGVGNDGKGGKGGEVEVEVEVVACEAAIDSGNHNVKVQHKGMGDDITKVMEDDVGVDDWTDATRVIQEPITVNDHTNETTSAFNFSTPIREQAPTMAAVARSFRPPSKPLRGILKTSNSFSILSGVKTSEKENVEDSLPELHGGKERPMEQGKHTSDCQNV